MALVVIGKRPFENRDSSLSMSFPRYKRRKVSAIRDFPEGCGPNAVVITPQKNEEGNSSQKEGEILRNSESSAKMDRNLCELVTKENSDQKKESKSHNVDNKVVESRVDLDLIESSHGINNKMVCNGTNLDPCLLPYYPIPLDFVWREPKYPLRRKVSAIRDFPLGCGRNVPKLDEVERVGQREESSKGDEIVDSKHAIIVREIGDGNVIEDKVDDLVSKEGVDKIEHSSKSDKVTMRKSHNFKGKVGISEEKVGGLNENEIEQLEYDRNDKVEGIVCEGGDTLEHSSTKSYELKGQEEVSNEKSSVGNENEMEQLEEYNKNNEKDTTTLSDELDENLIVYVKDKSKRKKSIGVPCRNVRLQEERRASVGTKNKSVIVQGLMSSFDSPSSQGKGVVTKTPTTSSVKKIKAKKKSNVSGQDPKKRLPSKRKDENLAEKSTMIIPYNDIDDVSRPLDTKYDDDSSENDDVNDFQLLPRGRTFEISLPPFGSSSSSERGIRSKVRETLRLFQAVYRKLLQEEETKSKDQAIESKRTDLQAAKILKDRGMYLNTKKVIGSVPGVEVGDIFNYRTELAIIGLHGPLQGGIDTMKVGKETIAISIVASGGYANDVDSSDVLIYTGQGGNASKDKEPEDQKLEKGNLALKNCIEKKNLVRVIRGFKVRESKPSENSGGRSKKIATYTYDGLYTVDRYFHDLGPHGKLVYKFELNRVPGQPELAWKELKQSKRYSPREGRLVADISEGKENSPISVVNTIDDESLPIFKYITTMVYPDWCQPIPSKGCDCKSGCSDSNRCACALKNGGEIPFNYNGAIVQAKPLVYECGPLCKCPPSCHNRVSQNGIKLPLEIFKTSSMGWGVRCLSAISSGSFICEYIGELLDDKEAEQRTGSDEYLFDIGQNYNDLTLWEGLSDLLPELASSSDSVIDVGFTIDAAKSGNIGRFINHSCSPNLYAQNVLYDHEDKRIPHIMFFAAENIPPLQELTYHYNYKIDEVHDSEGNIKKKNCYCGSAECTGRMY